MKKFINKVVLFAGTFLVLISALQLFISVYTKDISITGHDNLEQTKNVNADLVLLGSSRCLDHFDPAFFEDQFDVSTINLGVKGHSDLGMIYLRLENYLAKNTPPKYAILNFDPFISATRKLDSANVTLKDIYSRYAFFSSEENSPILDYFDYSFGERYIPLYSTFKYQLLDEIFLGVGKSNYLEFGYEKHDEDWDTQAFPLSRTNSKYFFSQNDMDDITWELQEIKTLCEQKNIRLLCIQSPVYQILYDKIVFEYPESICDSLKIPFIDANIPEIREDMKYFFNTNHLNTEGVRRLNQFLESNEELFSFFNE